MNNKKKIIEIVVIIAAFGISGVVLYNGFFSGPSGAPLPVVGGEVSSTAGGAGDVSASSLLPYGDKFDYQQIDNLQKRNFQFGINYPVVDPSTEVGKDQLSALIQAPTSTPGK